MKKIVYALSIVFLFSCGSEEKKENTEKKEKEESSETENKIPEIGLNDLSFLKGTWVDASGSMPGFHETWIFDNDSIVQVVGYFVNRKDTAIMEAIKVKMIHGTLHYIPKIENQNDGAEIPYELQNTSTKDSLIFANYGHDFPQIINYVKKTNDSVLVYLSGTGEDSNPMSYVLQLKKK